MNNEDKISIATGAGLSFYPAFRAIGFDNYIKTTEIAVSTNPTLIKRKSGVVGSFFEIFAGINNPTSKFNMLVELPDIDDLGVAIAKNMRDINKIKALRNLVFGFVGAYFVQEIGKKVYNWFKAQ